MGRDFQGFPTARTLNRFGVLLVDIPEHRPCWAWNIGLAMWATQIETDPSTFCCFHPHPLFGSLESGFNGFHHFGADLGRAIAFWVDPVSSKPKRVFQVGYFLSLSAALGEKGGALCIFTHGKARRHVKGFRTDSFTRIDARNDAPCVALGLRMPGTTREQKITIQRRYCDTGACPRSRRMPFKLREV